MTVIKVKDLERIREKYKDKNLIFCSGIFDLTHAGHVLFFEDCKSLGTLIVGVASDYAIKTLKGKNRPIFNEYIRMKIVDSLKAVDYVILNSLTKENPFSDLEKILEKLRPNIYVVNNDGFDLGSRRELCSKYGIKIRVLNRSCPKEYEHISTTSIIEKIKKS